MLAGFNRCVLCGLSFYIGSGLESGDVTHYMQQRLDHFEATSAGTWNQAYWVNDEHWAGAHSLAPVFLKIGGEGPMKPPMGKDFITDWLPAVSGICFTLEHRFYGCHNRGSCPYDVKRPSKDYLKHLNTEQALADLAEFQRYASDKYSLAEGTRWILIGGSYPGILAAQGRAEYPELFFASVASSAPVRGVVDFRGFEDTVSDAYALDVEGINGSESCRDAIIDAHQEVGELLASEAGRQRLASLFKISSSALSTAAGRQQFAGCGLAHFPAQINDPMCKGPACGIAQICHIMRNAALGTPMERLSVVRQSQNIGNRKREFDLSQVMVNCEMDTFWEDAAYIPMEAKFWAYQTCNEFGFYQTCEHGSRCLYVRGLISFQNRSASRRPDHFCNTQFGISAEENARRVAGSNARRNAKLAKASRILWVNGNVDPWSAQSHHTSPGEDQPVIWPVEGASHCAWMSASTQGEQRSLTEARRHIYSHLSAWLSQPHASVIVAEELSWQPPFSSGGAMAFVAGATAAISAIAFVWGQVRRSRRSLPEDLAAPLTST